jgi:hypothetical protein
MPVPVPADWSRRPKKALDEWEHSPDKYGLLYDELFDNFVSPANAESWEDFRGCSNELRSWGFRGQREAEWIWRRRLSAEENERCETFRPFPWLEVHMAKLQKLRPQFTR